jgi:hypothetical protein
MDIRLDKCTVFGMKKIDNTFQQFQPCLYLAKGQIPHVTIDGSFTYLGKIYDFKMDNSKAKSELVKKLEMLLNITSKLKVKSQTMLKILKLYIYSQIQFELKVYRFSTTWIDQNLDSLCIGHVRSWLELPVSSCIKQSISLSRAKGGINIPSLKSIAERTWLRTRHNLKSNTDPIMKYLWSNTSSNQANIKVDEILLENETLQQSMRQLVSNQSSEAESHFYELKLQGKLSKAVSESISCKNIVAWSNSLDLLDGNIFNFARKALIQQLPTSANLFRWKRTSDPFCGLCNMDAYQTNKHVLSNCSSVIALKRYTLRHNAILEILANWIAESLPFNNKLFVDLDILMESLTLFLKYSMNPCDRILL